MTVSGPEPPDGGEPEPLDYPADAGLPPPVYPPPYPGYYPHYHQPRQPYPPVKSAGTNGKAIAALVTSLAGLACCGLPSIVGLVLGLIAMGETKRKGQDGYGLAVAAVVISSLIMLGYALYLLLTAVF
ncbi:MAG: DUF4190 domain-containing protein [Actinomycetia bacterium]|nr:DUF4190 domain-containing protein [Actinomycetes bacterium]MCH9710252.1 DUF4190 domain-containing protein [Actinomycetes bacterium]MCH9767620.1 DUF4190 domain-containing protein [Actinomycetes bacterium]